MVDGYVTVAQSVCTRLEVKRSVFECTIEPVADEAQARAVLERLRRQHWDARHHCSAFILGPEGRIQRSNDDGEPAGTAGAPMLEVLRGAGVTDVVAVVTRWFGGTLLGAGGLVRAYSDAVRQGLAEAGSRRYLRVAQMRVELGHAEAARLESAVRMRGWNVVDTSWAHEVVLTLGVPPTQVGELESLLAELSGGMAQAKLLGHMFSPAP